MATTPLVLVTGASGYIGSWVASALLQLGFRVRGTVRSKTRKTEHLLSPSFAPGSLHKIELVEADLLKPETWPAAVAGCDYVLHVASPFFLETPKDPEKELYKPARDGTLNVLRAVAEATPRPRRVVLTSSFASVAYGRKGDAPGHQYTEADWSNPDSGTPDMVPYVRSKVMAERAAWDFVKSLPAEQAFELATVCPSTVFGPVLSPYDCASADILKKIITRELPMLPGIALPAVDIRLVTRAHVLAMITPGAAGHRFLVSTTELMMWQLGDWLAADLNTKGYSCPTTRMPNWVLRTVGCCDGTAAAASSQLGKAAPIATHAEVKTILGMTDADLHAGEMQRNIVEMAHSLIRHGLIPDKSAGKVITAEPPAWGPAAAVTGVMHASTIPAAAGAAAPAAVAAATGGAGVGPTPA